MGISFWQILIVALLVVLLFGRGKISDLMGDVAKGIKSFKKGMNDDDTEVAKKPVEDKSASTIDVTPEKDKTTTGS
ncbi:twin-arginine translocase TatA/TatE family subunit [Futiania mangrovi]|uniref:Sec-independent protein translocase protein TatA n=1 Tax=Futiania mangrovi TaxID=2959716 RepID=A0A9J6PIS8_9PROT|nr:twin-arginine translocase TatA/TatE family subunit [Futiania mangrovii]MCP1335978.1 twin-arginine translocase TatA/TatE family subunit [Futiania mangrovii]